MNEIPSNTFQRSGDKRFQLRHPNSPAGFDTAKSWPAGAGDYLVTITMRMICLFCQTKGNAWVSFTSPELANFSQSLFSDAVQFMAYTSSAKGGGVGPSHISSASGLIDVLLDLEILVPVGDETEQAYLVTPAFIEKIRRLIEA